MPQKKYRIIFYNHDEVFEIYARHAFASEMFGFLEVERLTFDDRSQVLVDPGQEKLRTEFGGVKRTWIPMNAIVRIDEVETIGIGRVRKGSEKVSEFPGRLR